MTKKYEVLRCSELGFKANGRIWEKGDIIESELTPDITYHLSFGHIKEVKSGTPSEGKKFKGAPQV